MKTNAELTAEVRGLSEAATPRPWTWMRVRDEKGWLGDVLCGPSGERLELGSQMVGDTVGVSELSELELDQKYIAYARDALPELASRLDAADAKIAELDTHILSLGEVANGAEARIAELEEELRGALDAAIAIESFEIKSEPNEVIMNLKSSMIPIIVDSFADLLKEHSVKNFLVFDAIHPTIGRLSLTIQKLPAKTPAEELGELRSRIAELEARPPSVPVKVFEAWIDELLGPSDLPSVADHTHGQWRSGWDAAVVCLRKRLIEEAKKAG